MCRNSFKMFEQPWRGRKNKIWQGHQNHLLIDFVKNYILKTDCQNLSILIWLISKLILLIPDQNA